MLLPYLKNLIVSLNNNSFIIDRSSKRTIRNDYSNIIKPYNNSVYLMRALFRQLRPVHKISHPFSSVPPRANNIIGVLKQYGQELEKSGVMESLIPR